MKPFKKISVIVGLISLFTMTASGDMITVDPVNFAHGTDITTAVPGVTLQTTNSYILAGSVTHSV